MMELVHTGKTHCQRYEYFIDQNTIHKVEYDQDMTKYYQLDEYNGKK